MLLPRQSGSHQQLTEEPWSLGHPRNARRINGETPSQRNSQASLPLDRLILVGAAPYPRSGGERLLMPLSSATHERLRESMRAQIRERGCAEPREWADASGQ